MSSLQKDLSLADSKAQRPSYYKRPSVYDAVAGRITASGFISRKSSIPPNKGKKSSSGTALPPEHVLFRSKKAPTRFAEYDIYFANERHNVSTLPDSDLLKALHTYTADFYSKTTHDKGLHDWKSLDGTALIALGILAEELVQDMIGKTGDLALTEGKPVQGLKSQTEMKSSLPLRPSRKKRKVDNSHE
ncbi:hypothetical protein GcM3_020026 [Golovinomyces cichoracearum]|uniref:Uncharacterized protein n=1 Tax=Golovinomyces cichoracearum TaxID=62708 RepID=A0A420J7Q4_9PEZI|nr:hypothetical protein GcM3_020026 [Golovinomyces cichoracearum]